MKDLFFLVWNNSLYYPLVNLLVFFYKIFFSNLGLGIIALTLFTRFILIPFTLPMLKSAKKQKEIQPELSALKEKYKGEKEKLAKAQWELFQKHGINPVAGCLPQIVQFIVLIALYNVFITILSNVGADTLFNLNSFLYLPFLKFQPGEVLHSQFLFWDLTKPDPYIILPGLAGATQFLLSKMMLPKTKKEEKLAAQTADKKDDVMYNVQEQMLYFTPIMTVMFGWKLPSGLVLYWLLTTVFSLGQQWYFDNVSGKLRKVK